MIYQNDKPKSVHLIKYIRKIKKANPVKMIFPIEKR